MPKQQASNTPDDDDDALITMDPTQSTPCARTAVASSLLVALLVTFIGATVFLNANSEPWSPQKKFFSSPLVITKPGNSYYFSIRGSDTNSGNKTHPWRYLRKATLLGGKLDNITLFLERGSTWIDESLNVDFLKNSKILAYGNASMPRPGILVSRRVYGNLLDHGASCVQLLDPYNVLIQNVHMEGCFYGVSVRYRFKQKKNNLSIERCSFRDIRSRLGQSALSSSVARAINIQSPSNLESLNVVNNIATELDSFMEVSDKVSKVSFRGNTLMHCSRNCIELQGYDVKVQQNVFLSGSPNIQISQSSDVIISASNGEIVDTDFRNDQGSGASLVLHGGNTRIERNTFYRRHGSAVLLEDSFASERSTIQDNDFIYINCLDSQKDYTMTLLCTQTNSKLIFNASNRYSLCSKVEKLTASGCGISDVPSNTVEETVALAPPDLLVIPPENFPDTLPSEITIQAQCAQTDSGCTLRYTLDGSRPQWDSAEIPSGGIKISVPSENKAINVRAFSAIPSKSDSVSTGIIPDLRSYATPPQRNSILGSFSTVLRDENINIVGWVRDSAKPNERLRVQVILKYASSKLAYERIADVKNNDEQPGFGFEFTLPLLPGTKPTESIYIDIYGVLSNGEKIRIPGVPVCTCQVSTTSCCAH
eukprot:m.11506 g.11506  ORF g.11506 m.11506 type:complete len:651 (-) comp4461_c0_seq1:29-1981(-)